MRQVVLDALATFLREKSSNGLFPIVAYGIDGETVLLLTTSIGKLPLAMDVLEDATEQGYNLGRHIARDRLERIAAENPHVFKLHTAVVTELGVEELPAIGRVVSIFGAPFFRQKAFGLIDICSFSLLTHPEQLSQLYSLTNVIGSATRRSQAFCAQLRVGASFGRSSTGDGFYLWHNAIGGNADVATFMLLVCVMTQAEAMRANGLPMRLKGSFVIDSAFMIFDSSSEVVTERAVPVTGVGAATNGAARLIAAAKPSQLLMMDFERPGQADETMTPISLVAQANELFRQEGAGAATLAFEPENVLRVEDKHGAPWYCQNVVGAVPNLFGRGQSQRVRIGLPPDPAPSISSVAFAAEP